MQVALNSLCFERQLAIARDQRRRTSTLVGGDGQLALKAKELLKEGLPAVITECDYWLLSAA
jgi:hypothetical protein